MTDSIASWLRAVSHLKVQFELLPVSTVILFVGFTTQLCPSVQAEESPSRPTIVGMDPEVARDLVAVLGEDFGRVAGLPLKLVANVDQHRLYLPETSGNVSVYDTESLRCIQRWPLHEQRCLDVALVDQGTKLVSIALDGTARLWNITAAKPIHLNELKLAAKGKWVSMSATPSGDRIAFRSDDSIALVDIRDGKLAVRKRLTAGDFQSGKVPFDYAVSPDGRWMVTNEAGTTSTKIPVGDGKRSFSWSDAKLAMWDLAEVEPQRFFELDGKTVSGLVFAPDSRHLYGHDPDFVPDGKMHEWIVEDGKLIVGSESDRGRATFGAKLVFNQDGRLAARTISGGLSITSVDKTSSASRGIIDLTGQVWGVTFLDEHVLLVGNGILQRWDWRDGTYQQRPLPAGHHAAVMGLYFDFHTGSLVSASVDSTLEWKLNEAIGKPTVSYETLLWKGATKLRSHPDRNGFALLRQQDNVQSLVGLTRNATGKLSEQFSIEMEKGSDFEQCWCFAMHPTEPIVATGHHNRMIFLWDVTTGQPALLTKWLGHNGHVCNLAFSPDGDQIVSVGWDHHTMIWDLTPHQARAGIIPKGDTLGTHADIVRSVAWSREGTHLASGGQDGKILLWKIENGNIYEPASLIDPAVDPTGKTHLNPATIGSLSFSQSGEYLLASGGNGTVRIWSVKHKTPVKTWQLPGWVWDAQYSPDESQIAIANNEGTVYVVRAPAKDTFKKE